LIEWHGITGDRVKALAFAGGLILVVAVLLTALLLLFMCSPDFHLERYGFLGIAETFLVLAGGVALGFLLLLWAKKIETEEVTATGEAFLKDLLGSGIVRTLKQEDESATEAS
jgi:NADPH:quinone reductase-like Zn-dependent oxidoreductase